MNAVLKIIGFVIVAVRKGVIQCNKSGGQYEGGSSTYQFHQNEDGSYTAIGNKGEKIQAKSFEELNDLAIKTLKDNCLKEKSEPILGIHSSEVNKREVFVRSGILKHNITIAEDSDFPTDQTFWKNLKEEYFKNPNHKLSDWVKMTRFMPDDLLQRNNEEKKLKEDIFKSEQIKKLRQGSNPNLRSTQNEGLIQPKTPISLKLQQMRNQGSNIL